MKNLIVCIAFAIVSTACVSSAQYAALKAQNDLLLQRSSATATSSDDVVSSPPAANVTVSDPAGATSVMYAREPHGPYQGTVGAQDRHVMKGPKLKLPNHVCASRGVWDCENSDGIGGADYDFYLAFEIDGMPADLQTGQKIFHPDTGEVLLAPTMTAYLALGESCVVDLTVRAYQDRGGIVNGVRVLDWSPNPSFTATKRIDACGSTVTYQEITESFF